MTIPQEDSRNKPHLKTARINVFSVTRLAKLITLKKSAFYMNITNLWLIAASDKLRPRQDIKLESNPKGQ